MWAMVRSFGLADPVDAPVLLLRLLVEFAVGGLLVRGDHSPSHVSLVADPPGGVDSLQQSGGVQGRHVVHGPRIRIGGPHEPSFEPDQDLDVHARPPALDRPQIAAVAPVPAGEEGAVHHVVAVLGHLLGREQQDRQGPGDRPGQSLDGPRNSGLRHPQELSDHRLHDVLTHVHQSRGERPGQAQDRRITLDPLLSQPGEQLVELVIGQSRGTLHDDGPLLPGSWGVFFYAHDTPRGWAIIISPPENDPGHTQNNLP